jgi:hypothetical protein
MLRLQQLLLHSPEKPQQRLSNGFQMTQQHAILNEIVCGIHKNSQGI